MILAGEVVHGRTDDGPKDGVHGVVGRALPAFTINVDCISVGSAHPTKHAGMTRFNESHLK